MNKSKLIGEKKILFEEGVTIIFDCFHALAFAQTLLPRTPMRQGSRGRVPLKRTQLRLKENEQGRQKREERRVERREKTGTEAKKKEIREREMRGEERERCKERW